MRQRGRKRVAVIGLGQFGRHLAVRLAADGDVLAIDRSHGLVTDIAPQVQRALALDAREYAVLADAIGEGFDEAVVAMSGSMEASILCVLHLKRLRVGHIIAKAANPDHGEILRAVGAHEIAFPERETAWRLATQMLHPNLLDFLPLSDDYLVMQIAPPNAFIGRTLAELNLRQQYGIYVVAVKEYVPERMLMLPGPDFMIKLSDSLFVIGREKSLAGLQELSAPGEGDSK